MSGSGASVNQGQDCQLEYGRFNSALRMVVNGSPLKPTKNRIVFTPAAAPYAEDNEPFYDQSFRRALGGKGSPAEITDLLRVAIIVGRIGIGQDPSGWKAARFSLATYVRAFLTLDCNGLVGNYYGITPDTPVRGFAVSARARRQLSAVKQGDAVVTVNGAGDHEHVALINDFRPQGGDKAQIRICEWGDVGNEDHHSPWIADGRNVTVQSGPNGSYGLGWDSGGKFRYIFGPPKLPTPRAWGLGNNDGW